MKKNKLYTINKYNMGGLCNPYKNLFSGGGQPQKGIAGALGSVMGGGKLAGSPMGGLVSGLGSAVGGLANNLISSGYSSGAGGAISGIGSTVGGLVSNVNPVLGAAIQVGSGIIGGGVNALFGSKVDEKKLKQANEDMAMLNNFTSTAESFDDIKGPAGTASVSGIYKGGLFNSSAAEQQRDIERRMAEARSFAGRSVDNNVFNLQSDQLNNALANYAAYGGSLDSGALGLMQQNRYFDTIDKRTDAIANKNNFGLGAFTGGAKTFADGGLAASFLDNFSTDPIGAAIRYNRGLKQLQAQREAEAAEAQRELDYQNMQKRMLALETQNQGLQALMAAQNQPTVIEEVPASSPTPSPATHVPSGNSTWDYIEGQLRKSGKFNDVQIQGIKYNLQRESSIDPTAVGDGGAAFGLGQWHGNRRPKDMSLEGQTQHLIDTLSNFDGKNHWIGRDNYNGFMNARTPEEAHYWITRGYERPAQRIVDKVKRDSDMSLKRLRAFGGELGTNGTDFTNGLLYIGEGGSHESNPMDGVQLGLDPEGIPNLVEEGETVYNDYVFSDRMMVPKFMYKELGLGGALKKGISFADASKKLAQESEQRPNDPISQAGLQASLSKLAEIQETERMKKQAEDYMGLQEYCNGGKLGNKFDLGGLAWVKKNHPEIKNPEAVAKAMEKAMQSNRSNYYRNGKWDFDVAWGTINHPSMFTSDEDAFNSWVANGLDRETAFELTHKMPTEPKNADLKRDYERKLKDREATYNRLVKSAANTSRKIRYKALSGKMYDTREEAVRDNANAARQRREAVVRSQTSQNTGTQASQSSTVAMGTSKGFVEAATRNTSRTTAQGSHGGGNKAGRIVGNTSSNRNYDGIHADTPATTSTVLENPYSTGQPVGYQRSSSSTPIGAETQGMSALAEAAGVTNDVARNAGLEDVVQTAVDRTRQRTIQQDSGDPYDTWMRYAPAVGAGLMTMTDLLGLTNNPDYTYADRLEAAAQRAGYAPNITYNPIGDYLTYRPLDIWYEQNALNAQSRATDRAILNSGANQGAQNAALLANGYNSQLTSGNLYRQAVESNIAQQHQVADFNRRTNMFNSQMGLEADMANARYHQQAQQMGLSGLAQAAALRDSIDARTGAARAANLSNLFNSLGDIGRENMAFNMVNSTRGAHNGYGYAGRNGWVNHSSAYGGKIKKCNK